MNLAGKEDWSRVRERFEAWWQRELLDRPLIQVTAPKAPCQPEPIPTDEQELFNWFTDPERVIPRLERQVAATYWGGDAFPILFPVSTNLPAIEDAYLGCPYTVIPGANTGWATPCIEDWANSPSFEPDPGNPWWRLSRRLLEQGAARAPGRYCVGLPDLQGGGQIVAEMRGSQRLAMDLIDCPEAVKAAVQAVNEAWWYYYRACFEIIHRYTEGYVDWLGIWSDSPAVTVECDFSAMISPSMFQEFFLPAVEQQTERVERTIYHLDGPGAIRHLDALLALPRLNGIQWVPGAGQAHMSEWTGLLRRIQAAGKLLVLACEPWEVEMLLGALRPAGVLLSTTCGSPEEAEELAARVAPRFGGGT